MSAQGYDLSAAEAGRRLFPPEVIGVFKPAVTEQVVHPNQKRVQGADTLLDAQANDIVAPVL